MTAPADGLGQLLELRRRYRAEQLCLESALASVQAESDHWSRSGWLHRLSTGSAPPAAMMTHSLKGADVTLMVSPPEGDGLWTIQGRIWLDPRADVGIRVALCQGENVLTETHIRDGGSFRLQDLLTGEWSLEFHAEDGRVAVVQGPVV